MVPRYAENYSIWKWKVHCLRLVITKWRKLLPYIWYQQTITPLLSQTENGRQENARKSRSILNPRKISPFSAEIHKNSSKREKENKGFACPVPVISLPDEVILGLGGPMRGVIVPHDLMVVDRLPAQLALAQAHLRQVLREHSVLPLSLLLSILGWCRRILLFVVVIFFLLLDVWGCLLLFTVWVWFVFDFYVITYVSIDTISGLQEWQNCLRVFSMQAKKIVVLFCLYKR